MDKVCELCGKMIYNAHHKQKYHKACARKMENNRIERYKLMIKRKRLLEREERKRKFDTTQCQTCLYRFEVIRGCNSWGCGYCYYTGHKRPCEPSPHCTVYREFDVNARMELIEKVKKIMVSEQSERGDEHEAS